MVTARLVAAFGDHRVSDDGLRELWLSELLRALGGYAPETVNLALSGVIRKSRYWPTIAELIDGINAELPRPSLPTFKEAPEPDRTPEEIARRMAAVAAMKKKHGWDEKFKREEDKAADWTKPKEEFYGYDTEVSDISPALKALRAKQGNHK